MGPAGGTGISVKHVRATQARPRHTDAVRALLEQDPVANLFLLDMLDRDGLPRSKDRNVWLLAQDPDRAIRSVLYGSFSGGRQPAATSVAWGDPAGCALLGRWLGMRGGTRLLVGPRAACDAVWTGLGEPRARTRFDQRLYVCDAPPEGDVVDVEPARVADVDVLVELHSAMLHEDLGIDPRDLDPLTLRAQALLRIRDQRTWVVRDDQGVPVFCIDIGTWGGRGAQVGGTYVAPSARGRGLAARAMRALNQRFLQEVPRVTLHVNEANIPAVKTYERSGFRTASPFRLMVL